MKCVLLSSLQDSGGFLSVIDDSNEHMLSVWDCAKETKLAEIKVNMLWKQTIFLTPNLPILCM